MAIDKEIEEIAKKVAVLLTSMAPRDGESMLLYFISEIARNVNHVNLAALELLKPVPVPPEVVAEANRTFNEKEVLEAIEEIRAGGGFKLQEFLPELEVLAHEVSMTS